MLLRFVYSLGDGFGPWVSATVNALLPSISQGLSPQMRCAAAAATPGLVQTAIKCCASSSPAPAQQLLLTVVQALVAQLAEEQTARQGMEAEIAQLKEILIRIGMRSLKTTSGTNE